MDHGRLAASDNPGRCDTPAASGDSLSDVDDLEKSTGNIPLAKSLDYIMDLFTQYLDFRELEATKDLFVAPPIPNCEHPYTESFRLTVIEWLYEIAQDAYVRNIILHHCVHLLDAIAPCVTFDEENNFRVVQLIAVAAVNLMQKVHADYSDLFLQVGRAAGSDFNLPMCEWAGLTIVKLTQPSLRQPTCMGFVQLYNQLVPVSKRTAWLMTYLADLVLVHGRQLRRVRFSLFAAAIYAIAVGTVNQRDDIDVDPWPFDLAKFTRIDYDSRTGDLLMEIIQDVHQLQKDFTAPEQGLLPSFFLKKYRSLSALGVASYAAMSRAFLSDMLDNLKRTAASRRNAIGVRNSEPDNLFIRSEPRGPSLAKPIDPDKPGSGSKGRYFSNPDNSQSSAPKKPRVSPDWKDYLEL